MSFLAQLNSTLAPFALVLSLFCFFLFTGDWDLLILGNFYKFSRGTLILPSWNQVQGIGSPGPFPYGYWPLGALVPEQGSSPV